MSVYKRTNEAYDYLCRGDAEAALTPLLNAVEAMSGGGKSRCKQWLAEKMPIISNCLLDCGLSARVLKLPVASDNKQIAAPDEHGSVALQEIIYHLVRCGLDHRCEIDLGVKDNDTSSIRWDNDVLHLHFGKLATGILLALISDISPAEAEQVKGVVNGYSLQNFCGLSVRNVVTMARVLAEGGPRRRTRSTSARGGM